MADSGVTHKPMMQGWLQLTYNDQVPLHVASMMKSVAHAGYEQRA